MIVCDIDLDESDRRLMEGGTNWGQGDKRRLYRLTGLRCTINDDGRARWRWLGHPCRKNGDGLRGARTIAVVGVPVDPTVRAVYEKRLRCAVEGAKP